MLPLLVRKCLTCIFPLYSAQYTAGNLILFAIEVPTYLAVLVCICLRINGLLHSVCTFLCTPAAPGDYDISLHQVEFNVTTQSGTFVVHAKMDNILEENDENFKAVLSVPAGVPRVFARTSSEATVTILDRTAAEVYFDPDVYNVTEGQPANLVLKLTKDVDPSTTIIVMVQTMDGSATGV